MAFQPSGGIAVIADNTWAAIQGRNALKIVWDDGPHATYDSQAYRAAMEATARQPGTVLRSEGDFAAAFAGAAKKVEAVYYIPHNAHATMKPSATCRIADGKAKVWTSVQSPQAAHDLVAKYLGLPGENVTVNVTLLGGGFGRKSKPDFAVEAALCSKAIGGAAVKVVWTREDDIRNDFYHTVSVERIQAGLDKDGKVVACATTTSLRRSVRSSSRPIPGMSSIGNWVRDCPICLSTSRTSASRTARPRRTPRSGGGARCRTCRTALRSSPSSRSLRAQPARTRRRSCST